MKLTSAEDAVRCTKSSDRVFIHCVASPPRHLIEAMTERAAELRGIEVLHLHTEGDAPYARPEYRGSFNINCLFIGAIPDAVLCSLEDHRDLGVHTEMFSDGVVRLVERGVINDSRKRVHRGKLVAGFVIGTHALYDFIDGKNLRQRARALISIAHPDQREGLARAARVR